MEIQIGEYQVEIPDCPNIKKVSGYKLPTAKQKWVRTELPTYGDMDYDELRAEEERCSIPFLNRKNEPDWLGNKVNPDFIDQDWVNPILEKFREQEWYRRLNGYWFMNNGVPTYIIGQHYFYLNWWKLDDGYPKYRKVDYKFFHLWKFCESDPKCFGLMEITRRRQGKSYRGSCLMYEITTRTKKAHSGMQSKERNAARDWFLEKMIGPWKELPDFFQPMVSTGSDPTTELVFKADAKKGAAARKHKAVELRSKITWGPSVKTHYDGQKMRFYFGDEVGKVVEEDAYARHYIVKKCCLVDDRIVGKMYLTTTVEEMEKGGGKNCERLWKDCDPATELNGATTSGLRRFFQPAYEGYKIDEYGNDLVEESKRELEYERTRHKNNAKALAAEKRMNPFTIQEAFRADGTKCHFDPERILQRLEYLSALEKPLHTTYKASWKNGKPDTEVVMKRERNGRFRITYLPDEKDRNNVQRKDGKPYKPLNKKKYCCAVDPFDHEYIADENRGSNAGAHVMRKYDFEIDGGKRDIKLWGTHRFVVEYICRPKPKEMYEDMIMLCVFFGCDILIETQKIGIRTHFKERGYGHFLMDRPESTHTSNTKGQKMEGLPQSPMILNAIVDSIDSYISEDDFGSGDGHGYVDNVDFPLTLEDWLEFDIDDTTKYDATISSGYCLIATSKHIKVKKRILNTNKYFHTFDNTGRVSVMNEEPEEVDLEEPGEEDNFENPDEYAYTKLAHRD